MTTRILAWLLALVSTRTAFADGDGASIEVEAGAVFTGRNDVAVPGSSGDRFSLADDLETAPAPVYRVRASYRHGRHRISALFAPLRLEATGTLGRDIAYAGGTFAAGSPLLATYRFDSYRLGYSYRFLERDWITLAGGVTGKIRDAEITLNGAERRTKPNTGFVPLLHLRAEIRQPGNPLAFVLDADALAAPQGRAEDILLAFDYTVRDDLRVYAGYRFLEGGADNDEVYAFAWLHYAVVGLTTTL